MKFRRLPEVVEAEIESATDFLRGGETRLIGGSRRSDPRVGYRITDDTGAVSWMPKDEFEKNFVEVTDGKENSGERFQD